MSDLKQMECKRCNTTFVPQHFNQEYYYNRGMEIPSSETWLDYTLSNYHIVDSPDSTYGYRSGQISYEMSVDDFPHQCYRFAGNGTDSEFKLTVTFDVAYEVRILFYYQLIPIQAVLQS